MNSGDRSMFKLRLGLGLLIKATKNKNKAMSPNFGGGLLVFGYLKGHVLSNA